MTPALQHKINSLNSQQVQVIAHSHANLGPLLVLAGAGSGKTTALTLRVASEVQQGIPCSGIFCLTFTVKAANEMKERLRLLLPEQHFLPWIGTFHSLGLHIIRSTDRGIPNWTRLGMPFEPKVWEENDWYDSVQKRIQNSDLNHWVLREHLELFHETQQPECPQGIHASDWSALVSAIEELGKESGKIGFGEMIDGALWLLEHHPEVLIEWQNRVQQLLVDEYQDIDPKQYRMCRLLLGGNRNFIAVGDDDQAIYGFRGADPTCILNFQMDFPESTLCKLEDNYRSHPSILKLANQIFTDKDPNYRKILRAGRQEKSREFMGPSIHKFNNGFEECQWICQSLNRIRSQGHSLRDCAILCRYNRLLEYYRGALRYWGIPLLEDENDGVQLMTLHGSKGLEFPFVFYCGLSAGLSPGNGENLDEEKRLFYVGVTRARDRLFLVHSSQRVYRDKLKNFEPSPFQNYFKRSFWSKCKAVLWDSDDLLT